MRQRLAFAAAVGGILAAALLLRLPRLGDRPFHGDEAVHAAKFRELWEHGRYDYDPNEYHGPTLYYAVWPVVIARGRASFAGTREADYRLAIGLLGAAMVLLYPLLRDGMGDNGTLWAALLTAVSPAFVFYSRTFIQEVPLAAFTLALIACWWRYRISGRTAWLMAAALCAGLVLATKETAVLVFAALGLGWLAGFASAGRDESSKSPQGSPTGDDVKGKGRAGLRVAVVSLLALAVAFTLLSGLFSNLRGPLGYFETFTPWLRRAAGTELHRQPWHYYLALLAWQRPQGGAVWTELFVLGLAVVGALTASFPWVLARLGAQPLPSPRVTAFTRFAFVYTVALTVSFCLIPYKTPWNALCFYLGFILLAGLGAAAILSLLRPPPLRALGTVLLLAGAGHLAWQAQRTTFHYRDDNAGPYAYAQPLRGAREIEQRVNELAAVSAQKEETVAQGVFADGYYWPLPWSLRRLKQVGYWAGAVPREEEARLRDTPIVLASAKFDEPLTERLSASHFMTGFYSLRPGVLVQLWVRNDLWEAFVKSRQSERTPEE